VCNLDKLEDVIDKVGKEEVEAWVELNAKWICPLSPCFKNAFAKP